MEPGRGKAGRGVRRRHGPRLGRGIRPGLAVLKDQKSPVIALAYSADGRRLAAFGVGGTAVVWDADTGARPTGSSTRGT